MEKKHKSDFHNIKNIISDTIHTVKMYADLSEYIFDELNITSERIEGKISELNEKLKKKKGE